MAHEHDVWDTNEALVVDASTRTITNPTGKKVTLVQFDHNSERVTFKIPRYIDDHDMLKCDKVEVHYNNVGNGTSSSNRAVNSDMYDVADLIINPDDENTVLCTWLISRNATQFHGFVEFKLKFVCYGKDDKIDYELNTRKNDNVIEVAEGLDNSERVTEEYSDVIAQLDIRLSEVERGGVSDDKLAEIITDYFRENPIEAGATQEEREQIQANTEALADKMNNSGYTPNMYLGTDNAGNVVTKIAPSGNGVTVNAMTLGGTVLTLVTSGGNVMVDLAPIFDTRNFVYYEDGESGGDDENGVVQTGNVLAIINDVTVTQTDSVLSIGG